MAKGGHREGAGRPKGAKDAHPRKTKNQMPIATRPPDPALPSRANYLRIDKYLSAENRKLYKNLAVQFESPVECLKAIRDDLVARYNLGRIGEIEEVSFIKKEAKEGLQEIEQFGTLKGKQLDDNEKPNVISRLQKQLKQYPELSSKVTSLAGEIRQINELIDRIESGRPDQVINLFNILEGRAAGAKQEKVDNLREKIFTLPETDTKEEVVEADFKEVEDENENKN